MCALEKINMCDNLILPLELVAMSATFWKASRKATAARMVVLWNQKYVFTSQWQQETICATNSQYAVWNPNKKKWLNSTKHVLHCFSPELRVQFCGFGTEVLPYRLGALTGEGKRKSVKPNRQEAEHTPNRDSSHTNRSPKHQDNLSRHNVQVQRWTLKCQVTSRHWHFALLFISQVKLSLWILYVFPKARNDLRGFYCWL